MQKWGFPTCRKQICASTIVLGVYIIKNVAKHLKDKRVQVDSNKYGAQLAVVRMRKLPSITIAIVCLSVVLLLYLTMRNINEQWTSVPIRVQKLILYIIYLAGTVFATYNLLSPLYDRIIIYERAIILIKLVQYSEIWIDNIESIIWTDSSCTLNIFDRKSIVIKFYNYIDVEEILRTLIIIQSR